MTRLELQNPFFSAPVFHIAETGSTMDDAAQLASEGNPSGFALVTDFQTAGRGRTVKRQWESPRGKNLLFTLALKCTDIPNGAAALSLRSGLGLAFLLEKRWNLNPRIKWPNDLLVRGGKIAGILCQGRGDWCFIGIGLNLISPEPDAQLRRRASSVMDETGKEEIPSAVLCALLPELKAALAAPNWREQINLRLFGSGKPVTVYPGAAESGVSFRARLSGLAPDGSLNLVDDQGHHVSLVTGELDYENPPVSQLFSPTSGAKHIW